MVLSVSPEPPTSEHFPAGIPRPLLNHSPPDKIPGVNHIYFHWLDVVPALGLPPIYSLEKYSRSLNNVVWFRVVSV